MHQCMDQSAYVRDSAYMPDIWGRYRGTLIYMHELEFNVLVSANKHDVIVESLRWTLKIHQIRAKYNNGSSSASQFEFRSKRGSSFSFTSKKEKVSPLNSHSPLMFSMSVY